MRYLSLILIVMLAIVSCKKDDTATQADTDEQIIKDYLANNSLEATRHESGIYYNIVKEGGGSHPNVSNTIIIKYKGQLIDGTVFDESGNSSATFPLSSLIRGWQFGVPLLKPGGKGIFYIPSALGYGPNGTANIPANSVLIFEIELIDFY